MNGRNSTLWTELALDLTAGDVYEHRTRQTRANAFAVFNPLPSGYIYLGFSNLLDENEFLMRVAPQSWGLISRPSNLPRVYLYTPVDAKRVKLIEIWTEEPVQVLVASLQQASLAETASVSIDNGKDVAQGSTSDVPRTNPNQSGTVISWLKGLIQIFSNVWDATNNRLRVAVTNTVTVTGTVNTISGGGKSLQRASINLNSAGDHTVIPAPGAGKRIHITHLSIQNVGSQPETVTLKDGGLPINGAGFKFDPTSGYAFDAPGGAGNGDLILSENTAFVINLSSGSQISGFVIYYVE